MTKGLYAAEKVLEAVLADVDDDQDYGDPDELFMEGSDDPTWNWKMILMSTNHHQTFPFHHHHHH